MDNRTDVTEDQQSTPEHPPPQVKTGLTAGPHDDPPPSAGIEDKYQPPATDSRRSAWTALQRTAARYPMQIAFSVAGLGLAVMLLALRKARAH
jgi:hypothetical protein